MFTTSPSTNMMHTSAQALSITQITSRFIITILIASMQCREFHQTLTFIAANPQSELAHIITLLINYTLNKYSIPRSAPQIHLFFVACVGKNKARIPFPFTYHNFTYRSHNGRPKNNPPPNPFPRENAFLFENGTKNHFFGLQNFTLSHDHTLEPSITLLGSDLEVAVNDTI